MLGLQCAAALQFFLVQQFTEMMRQKKLAANMILVTLDLHSSFILFVV